MDRRWDGKSKGTVLGYKIFLFFIKTFGVSSAYFIVRFVSYYYFLFAKKNREALIRFYIEGLNYSEKDARAIAKKNFLIFGQTLIDRAAFLVGKSKKFTYSFKYESYLKEMEINNKGGVLLSAHLGNWETAGNILKEQISKKINVVMIDAEVEKIKKYLHKSTGGSLFNIIPVKDDLSHVVSINIALNNSEFVAIHADRLTGGMKHIELDFLGCKAKFPMGPFIIASKFNAPVSFVFAMKEQNFHYALSSTPPTTVKMTPEEIAISYIKAVEEKVKQYPEQWFNYFDFFHQ